MAVFFAFFFFLLLFAAVFVFSIAGSLLNGLFRLFGFSSDNDKKNYSGRGAEYGDGDYSGDGGGFGRKTKSEEGARRMREFKKVAEDVEFEEM